MFTAPSFSLSLWIREHTLETGIAGGGFLLTVVLTVWLIVRGAKKKKRRKQRELQAIADRQQATQQAAEAAQRELNDFRKKTEDERRLSKELEQDAYFLSLMQTKNLFPRLQYTVNGANHTFTVRQLRTSIGREADNDIALPDKSVSRHHALIVFTGSAFEIQDLGSTNKVIVNGRFVQQTVLAGGDIIGLGEVIIYFYV
jgi:predicted component of type VI protein secretion system